MVVGKRWTADAMLTRGRGWRRVSAREAEDATVIYRPPLSLNLNLDLNNNTTIQAIECPA